MRSSPLPQVTGTNLSSKKRSTALKNRYLSTAKSLLICAA